MTVTLFSNNSLSISILSSSLQSQAWKTTYSVQPEYVEEIERVIKKKTKISKLVQTVIDVEVIKYLENLSYEPFLIAFFNSRKLTVIQQKRIATVGKMIESIPSREVQNIAFSVILDKSRRSLLFKWFHSLSKHIRVNNHFRNRMKMFLKVLDQANQIWKSCLKDNPIINLERYEGSFLPPALAKNQEIISLKIQDAPNLVDIEPVYQLRELAWLMIKGDKLCLSTNIAKLTRLGTLKLSHACLEKNMSLLGDLSDGDFMSLEVFQ